MGRGNKDASQINGLIDRGCSVEGKLMFDGTVQINGDFRGEILSDGTLIVGAEAKLNARIQIDTIVIEGNVEGTIEAKRKVELRNGGSFVGDLVTPALAVEEGAIFQGRCQMLGDSARETTQPQNISGEAVYAEEGEDSLMM
ncbi:MAG: polymer-forming cytoskeletal protein [bacterium]